MEVIVDEYGFSYSEILVIAFALFAMLGTVSTNRSADLQSTMGLRGTVLLALAVVNGVYDDRRGVSVFTFSDRLKEGGSNE